MEMMPSRSTVEQALSRAPPPILAIAQSIAPLILIIVAGVIAGLPNFKLRELRETECIRES